MIALFVTNLTTGSFETGLKSHPISHMHFEKVHHYGIRVKKVRYEVHTMNSSQSKVNIRYTGFRILSSSILETSGKSVYKLPNKKIFFNFLFF